MPQHPSTSFLGAAALMCSMKGTAESQLQPPEQQEHQKPKWKGRCGGSWEPTKSPKRSSPWEKPPCWAHKWPIPSQPTLLPSWPGTSWLHGAGLAATEAPSTALSAPHSLYPEFSHRKMDKTHTFSSVHLPHIQYKRGFSQLVQRFVPEQVSPVCRKASKTSSSCFLPLVMLRVLLHFIYISFYSIFSSIWITHWSLDLHGFLTSYQKAFFPLKRDFVERLYLTQQVGSLRAFTALSADIRDKNKFLLTFIPTNSVVFT